MGRRESERGGRGRGRRTRSEEPRRHQMRMRKRMQVRKKRRKKNLHHLPPRRPTRIAGRMIAEESLRRGRRIDTSAGGRKKMIARRRGLRRRKRCPASAHATRIDAKGTKR